MSGVPVASQVTDEVVISGFRAGKVPREFSLIEQVQGIQRDRDDYAAHEEAASECGRFIRHRSIPYSLVNIQELENCFQFCGVAQAVRCRFSR